MQLVVVVTTSIMGCCGISCVCERARVVRSIGGGVNRSLLRSGVRLAQPFSVLTVRVEEPSLHEAIESLGVRVLRVLHPLPACERIRVNRPIAVVVGSMIRAEDMECVSKAAAEVEARLVEVGLVGADQLVGVLQRVLNSVVVRRSVLPSAV